MEELNVKQRLSTVVRRRILKFFGHVMRRGDDNFKKLIVQDKIESIRPRRLSQNDGSNKSRKLQGHHYRKTLEEQTKVKRYC